MFIIKPHDAFNPRYITGEPKISYVDYCRGNANAYYDKDFIFLNCFPRKP